MKRSYGDIIALIDALLVQDEIRRPRGLGISGYSPNPTIYLQATDLCPEGFTRRYCYNIYLKLQEKGGVKFVSDPSDPGPIPRKRFFYETGGKSLMVRIYPDKLNQYRRELINDMPEDLLDPDEHKGLEDLIFDLDDGIFRLGNRKCESMGPGTIEYVFCKFMFQQDIDKPVEWESIYEEIEGVPLDNFEDERKALNCVMDTRKRIKKKLKIGLNFKEELFKRKNNRITRQGGRIKK